MILDRMAEALAILERRYPRRVAKAFYLGSADWIEFEAAKHETGRFLFGNNPQVERVEKAFMGLPVRESRTGFAQLSRLYDTTTTGHLLPGCKAPPVRVKPTSTARPETFDISPAEVEAALDAISRTRALNEAESVILEAAIKGRVLLTKRDAARLGVGRRPRS